MESDRSPDCWFAQQRCRQLGGQLAVNGTLNNTLMVELLETWLHLKDYGDIMVRIGIV